MTSMVVKLSLCHKLANDMIFEDWWEQRVKPVNPDPAAKLAAMSAWTFVREQCAKTIEDIPSETGWIGKKEAARKVRLIN